MKKLRALVVLKKTAFLLVLSILLIASVFGYIYTKVNYSLIDYLPENSKALAGIEVSNEKFGVSSYARVMLKDIDVLKVAKIKKDLSAIKGVKYTLWLDDIVGMVVTQIMNSTQTEQIVILIQNLIEKLPEKPPQSLIDMLTKIGNKELTTEDTLEYIVKEPIILNLVDLVLKDQFLGAIQLGSYYDTINNNALIEIYFSEDDYSMVTDKALTEIDGVCKNSHPNAYFFDGTAVSSKAARDTTSSEAMTATLCAIPLVLVILIFCTKSYLEPLLFLIVIGVSVVFNLGSNYLLQLFNFNGGGGISFITSSMAAALQMAISMDYSIFLLHSYQYEKTQTIDKRQALRRAMKHSYGPILASCLTTVAGFLAISFMQFKIGLDIGVVFAKGIVLSFACVFLVMPFFIGLFDNLIVKTAHRSFLPKPEKLARFTTKAAVPIVIAVLLLAYPAYSLQSQIKFLYGESAVSGSEGTRAFSDSQAIKDTFGIYNPVMLIIPKSLRGDPTSSEKSKEMIIIEKIKNISYKGKKTVTNIMAYAALVKPGMEGALPPALTSNFDSADGTFTRIIANVAAETESEAAFYAYEEIEKIVQPFATQFYITGSTVAAWDMKNTIETDYAYVNIIAIICIAVIVLVMFKSLLIPILLVSTIEIGIFINMALSALTGGSMAFLGYLVVSLIELGATIDYAILLTKNYVEKRRFANKKTAAELTVIASFGSVVTSSAILCAAGFLIGFMSSVAAVSQIGILIGRGALISAILVLLFLPPLLYLLDKYIQKLSLGLKFYNGKRSVAENVVLPEQISEPEEEFLAQEIAIESQKTDKKSIDEKEQKKERKAKHKKSRDISSQLDNMTDTPSQSDNTLMSTDSNTTLNTDDTKPSNDFSAQSPDEDVPVISIDDENK